MQLIVPSFGEVARSVARGLRTSSKFDASGTAGEHELVNTEFSDFLGAHARSRAMTRLMNKATHEDVFYLPGKIDIRRLEQLQQVERVGDGGGKSLMTRFMVRGHYRRANPGWKDQRLRWIEPYWKGPELATIIEREYRLRE